MPVCDNCQFGTFAYLQDVRFERRLLKERQQEDHLFEGKDKFITSAYRKKLEEDKKWVEAQKQKWVGCMCFTHTHAHIHMHIHTLTNTCLSCFPAVRCACHKKPDHSHAGLFGGF